MIYLDIGWNFPSNNDGQIRGINDAGIEHFSGKEIKSLAREICQNSLDAAASDSPVEVEFYKHFIESKNIPNYSEYKKVLQKCQQYWNSKSEFTKQYLQDALNSINKEKTFVMRISDYNTQGLSNPYDLKATEGWNTLTKIDGGAMKSGASKGGYFGIGKNAPFSNSAYRLIFYRTLNEAGERAAQGMSRLISFEDDKSHITSGVGYYGNKEHNQPIESIKQLDELNKRDTCGTDVFIYGFNGIADRWEDEVCAEILDNFLMSIYRGNLKVKVQDRMIDKNTFGKLIGRFAAKIKYAYNYYKVLNDVNTKSFTKNFHDLGQLKLSILINPNEKLNKRVLVIRKAGMKLFDMDKISNSISFTGILELEGDNLNEYFRKIETPAHNNWEPNKLRWSEKIKQAKDYILEIRDWIKSNVYSIGETVITDEVEVKGLSNTLKMSKSNDETINKSLLTIEELENSSLINRKALTKNNDDDKYFIEKTNGFITDKGGDNSAIRTLKGTRERKSRINHHGIESPDGTDIINKKFGRKVKLENVHIIKTGNKNYRMIFEAPSNLSTSFIEIMTVGENNKSNKLNIENAQSVAMCDAVEALNDIIKIKNITARNTIKIDFTLQDEINYAMEVNLYEDK